MMPAFNIDRPKTESEEHDKMQSRSTNLRNISLKTATWLLCVMAVFMWVLSTPCMVTAATYADSGHGDGFEGVKRSGTGYDIGDCTHCHDYPAIEWLLTYPWEPRELQWRNGFWLQKSLRSFTPLLQNLNTPHVCDLPPIVVPLVTSLP